MADKGFVRLQIYRKGEQTHEKNNLKYFCNCWCDIIDNWHYCKQKCWQKYKQKHCGKRYKWTNFSIYCGENKQKYGSFVYCYRSDTTYYGNYYAYFKKEDD